MVQFDHKFEQKEFWESNKMNMINWYRMLCTTKSAIADNSNTSFSVYATSLPLHIYTQQRKDEKKIGSIGWKRKDKKKNPFVPLNL